MSGFQTSININETNIDIKITIRLSTLKKYLGLLSGALESLWSKLNGVFSGRVQRSTGAVLSVLDGKKNHP